MIKLLGVFLASCIVCTLVGQAGAQESQGQQWQAKRQAMQQEMQKVNQLREQMKSLREQMCQVRDSMHSMQHVDHQGMQPAGGQAIRPMGIAN